MNLKGLLPQDVEYIQEFFADIVTEYRLDMAEAFLVRHSVMRILANETRAQGKRRYGEGWWDPAPRGQEVTHIVDWLRADLAAAAPWLENTDEKGRPRKLTKCGTIADLLREADKAMDRRNGGRSKKSLGLEDEEVVADLGGGYSIVRLLTPEALDLESDRMHHCVGDGAYDKKLASGWWQYLSVRDCKNRPVATIELGQENNGCWGIVQIQGKRNGRPAREIMNVIHPYALEERWQDRHYWWPSAKTPGGVEYSLDSIPAGATVFHLDIDPGALWVYPDLALPAASPCWETPFLTPTGSRSPNA